MTVAECIHSFGIHVIVHWPDGQRGKKHKAHIRRMECPPKNLGLRGEVGPFYSYYAPKDYDITQLASSAARVREALSGKQYEIIQAERKTGTGEGHIYAVLKEAPCPTP